MITFETIHTVTTDAAAAAAAVAADYHHHHPSLFVAMDTHLDSKADVNAEGQIFILAKTSKEIASFRTVQKALKKFKIVMRKIHETNVLYVCSENDWQEKVNQYMKEKINVYRLMGPITTNTTTTTVTEDKNTWNASIQHLLRSVNQQTISTLDHLLHSQAITREQFEQMTLHSNQIHPLQVNELYFIPKLYENDIFIQPLASSYIKEPIRLIASYLNILLQPLIEEIIHTRTSLSTGNDAIIAFESYAQRGHLQSTTHLATIYIHDLYNTLPHYLMLEELEIFLLRHASHGQIEGISIKSILQLVRWVLENQFYVYKNQLYQQIAGGPTQTSLIRALIDIYLFNLQQPLISILDQRNELFGRSFNQIFVSWNGTKDELNNIIYENFLLQSKYTSLKVKVLINDKIQYLDAELSHSKGSLQTKVGHNFTIEPYALPYLFRSKLKANSYERLLRAALIRACLYCSNVLQFESERLLIDFSFTINDIPLDLIRTIYKNFLHDFKLIVNEQCINEDMYQDLRQRLRRYQQIRTSIHLRDQQQRRKQRQRQIIKKNT